MGDLARRFIREPDTGTPEAFARRVRWLAALHLLLPALAAGGLVVLFAWGRQFVTLAQRSNVETLTLAFLVIFFSYLFVLSARGIGGALRVLGFGVMARHDRAAAERRKQSSLGGIADAAEAALNVVVEREGSPGAPVSFELADDAGSLGRLVVDGARVTHAEPRRRGSQNLFAFLARQIRRRLATRGDRRDVDVVEWKAIDDEETEQFLGFVDFARNLSGALGKPPLWPTVRLTADDCAAIERELSRLVPALRDEALLPEWEYSAEHKLPIIPEPLGIVSLGRTEKRADPMASLGCATLIVATLVAVLALFIVFPPWVPGK